MTEQQPHEESTVTIADKSFDASMAKIQAIYKDLEHKMDRLLWMLEIQNQLEEIRRRLTLVEAAMRSRDISIPEEPQS